MLIECAYCVWLMVIVCLHMLCTIGNCFVKFGTLLNVSVQVDVRTRWSWGGGGGGKR